MSASLTVAKEQQRDKVLVLNINKWLNDDILPTELQHLTNWDIYETLHDDKVSIVEVGSTLYKNKPNVAIDSFLDDSDEDDDIKQNPKTGPLEVSKIEMLRIVFDFNSFELDNDENKAKAIAIYHKQHTKYQQIFKTKGFNDTEIHHLCMESEHDLNDTEQCDLSLLFKSLSKKQLVNGIKSFINFYPKKNNRYLLSKIKDLRDLDVLRMRDKDYIMLVVAQIAGIDDAIINQFNTCIDGDLDYLMHHQFKQNMRDLKNELNASNFDVVLNDIESICKKASSLHQLHQRKVALDALMLTVKQFLIDFLCATDVDDLYEIDIESNCKLNYRISDLETVIETISNAMNVRSHRQKLAEVKVNLMKWQKVLQDKMPVFGPLFSDNIRSLNKKLNSKKRKRDENDMKDNSMNDLKRQRTD